MERCAAAGAGRADDVRFMGARVSQNEVPGASRSDRHNVAHFQTNEPTNERMNEYMLCICSDDNGTRKKEEKESSKR